MRFLDPMHGFVRSADPASAVPGAQVAVELLLATADGGATWWAVTGARAGALEVVPPATVLSGADVSFDGGATWETWAPALGGRWPAVGAGRLVFHEPTGFTDASLAPGAPGRHDGAFPWEGPMASLALADADRWFGVDLNGVIWVTATAGR